MVPTPAALLIGHPGHELRLHRWLEIAKPLVFVVTDGSGSGQSRIATTVAILRALDCTPGSIIGAFTDHEIYRLLLSGDVDPIAAITLEVADSLIERDVRAVVADALEWYNPTHDLCSVMADLAVERAHRATGRSIARYDYAVAEAPAGAGETFVLDDAALDRKLAAAHANKELALEVENLIARIGLDALRREVLRPITGVEASAPDGKPFYETHGESRVAAGHYSTVIRFEQHFRPFVERLSGAVRATPAMARHGHSS
jgi:hypothetical protein